ncbi:FHA domain-containing protein [Cryobacterium sp. Sr8]|uniref:FHA domain-containing protein n=1 Tax=Cryobacterium sp. Sr8 TaxID=1259203 RepID=UPI00106D0091|nr:FHA domain-containing protein [Cryobacterium sp. Sr8]TFD76148.1 FHA domain-containing protein [Cryobacterium sp. Sr8]
MTALTRLDIDLTFSLTEPGTPDSAAEAMQGTIRASGTEVEIFTSNSDLLVQGSAAMLRHVREIAAELAERGLTVSLSGPEGLIVRIGAVSAPLVQRIVTRSPNISLGSSAVLAPLLLLRRNRLSAPPALPLPPPTLFPLVPTFNRRIKRRVTTTHYAPGAGRPRLIFVIGSENWHGQMPREFDLLPTVTTIGGAPTADLHLDGLRLQHAEIRHDENDEYVLYPLGPVGGIIRPGSAPGQPAAGTVLRTGARIEMGPWRMAFFREEYADHGRPFGGRAGGELAHQKPQPSRRTGQLEGRD